MGGLGWRWRRIRAEAGSGRYSAGKARRLRRRLEGFGRRGYNASDAAAG
jgi:hypothetical protein